MFEKYHTLIEKYILSLKNETPFYKIFLFESPKSEYEYFCNWIIKENTTVAKMDNQMKEAQYETLRKTYSKDDIKDVIGQMENKKDLLKKYSSVYLTANNWLKRR